MDLKKKKVGKMKFRATEGQARRIAVNAINVSSPVGLGICHFENKNYLPEDVHVTVEGDKKLKTIYLDYFKGRMVKLIIRETEPGIWRLTPDKEFRNDYQSFASIYPTPKELIESVEGVQIINDEGESLNENN